MVGFNACALAQSSVLIALIALIALSNAVKRTSVPLLTII